MMKIDDARSIVFNRLCHHPVFVVRSFVLVYVVVTKEEEKLLTTKMREGTSLFFLFFLSSFFP